MHAIELRFSESLVRKAVMEFYKRTVGLGVPIVFGLMLLFFVYLLLTGNSGWVTGVVGAALAFAAAILTALYVIHFRGSMRRFRSLQSPTALLELRPDSLTLKSDLGSNEIPSKLILEVWAFDDFWLVFLSRSQFFTIPLVDMSSDDRAVIQSRFDDWGLKVR